MPDERILPDDPLTFIKKCVNSRSVLWTYHVNMRIKSRFISRQMILESAGTYESIESYPEDKYLPSYLVHAQHETGIFHALFAVDVRGENIRVVTAYRPNPELWSDDMKRRKKS